VEFFWFSAHLIVPLTFGLWYSRSRKLKILLVFCSLNRTFASVLNLEDYGKEGWGTDPNDEAVF
jgi:hypothetical protein